MRIAASSVELQASAVSYTSTRRKESVKAWIGAEEPPDRPQAVAARPALAALAAMAEAGKALAAGLKPAATLAGAAAPAEDGANGEGERKASPKDELDLEILRRTFRFGHALTRAAREIQQAYADPGPAEEAAKLTEAGRADQAGQGAPAQPPPRQGWGLRYDLSEQTVSYEAATFSAAARVTTADGRTIQVEAALAMERLEVTSREVHVRAGDAAKVDPLVLNLAGAPASLAGAAAFDLDADGVKERVATLGAGSAYLALDRNGNGAVDSGAELFGPTTGSGFGELAALDQDRNGWVDEGDAAFSQLRLWSPASGGLSTLRAANVGAIYTGAAATPFALKDGGAVVGSVAETGLFLREDGTAGTVQHVDLVA